MNPNVVWWVKMGVLAAISIGLYVWIWRQVKKGDDQLEDAGAFRKELLEEMERYNAMHRVGPLPRADIDAPYEAFMLDGSDHPHPPKKAA